MSGETNTELVDRARNGDRGAFDELFRPHEAHVARLCRRMLDSASAAEDAAHEVFIRAQQGIRSYAPERPFRPWLLGIAGHHCIDQLRRRRTEARLFTAGDFESSDLLDPGPSPLRQVVDAEERRELLGAIDALPIRYRLPLVLRYYSELDYDGIADVLGVTRNQVGSLLFRARRRLREQLAGGAVVPIGSPADRHGEATNS